MYDPLQDGKSKLELVDFMGGDLAVVNAARVSYNRESKEFSDKDRKLLQFLIDPPEGKQHTSSLRSTVFVFRVKAPLFVCRQWWKHHVASSHVDEQDQWNERSLRYSEITDEEDYYIPPVFHEQRSTNKQKGGQEIIDGVGLLRRFYRDACNTAIHNYRELVQCGVAREEARAVLPAAMYTTFVWTVSLQAVLHFIDLREGAGAQREIIEYAKCIKDIVSWKCPHTLEIWEQRKAAEKEALRLYKEKPSNTARYYENSN